MRKVEFVYNNLRHSCEKVLKSFNNRGFNKNNPDNKFIILEHLQNRESEKCKVFLSSLNDFERYMLTIYICEKDSYGEEKSDFAYASIMRLFFEDCDYETLVSMRMANLTFESGVSNEVNEIRKKYAYFFNKMCSELSGTECDTDEVRNILYNVNYVMGTSLDESIIKKEIECNEMHDVLCKEFEACVIYLFKLGEDEILNNKDKISLMVNYMRSILLCVDEEDVEHVYRAIESLPTDFGIFVISLVKSFFDNIDADREKYIGKSKVMM